LVLKKLFNENFPKPKIGCNHNQIRQQWQKTQPQMGPFLNLDFFIEKIFWQIFLLHVFKNILKVYKFY
jgi:hypothetical protein